MANINYITNCNLFLVENSGNEGYFYEPEYYTTIADARVKQAQWIGIGDTAKITVIEVTSRIFNEINENWGGGVTSLYDLTGVNGITVEEIGACLNPNNYEEELPEQKYEKALQVWRDFIDHDADRLEPEKFDGNEFADWLMNPERKNESAALMLAKHFVKDTGKESVADMRERLDFAENALREKIAKIAHKKGLMEIELQEKLTDQGIDAENIEAICAIYDRMLADQMEREVMA